MQNVDGKYKYFLDLVAFHITSVCAHRCPFCYAAASSRQKHPPLTQLQKVVDALADGQVKEVSLLGGDPGAYPHVVSLAKYVKKTGMRVSILSNTLKFPNSSIKEAASYFNAMETTIHDVEARSHDDFCSSKGAYRRVIKRLREAAGVGCKIGIAVNVMPLTANRLYDIVGNIVNRENVPLDYIIVQRIVPFGRAAESAQFTLTRKQAESALYEIKKVDEKLGIKISVEDPFPLCVLPVGLRKYMVPCQWGFTKASVSAMGDLSRCGADTRYRLGNILDTSLLDIWNNSETLKSFRSRDYLPGRCQTCSMMEKCGGGCPLSCEIEKDHGIDYLYMAYEVLDEEIHGEIRFSPAMEEELSSILQIEWSNFPGYGHILTVDSLSRWFNHNPKMFWVVRDSRNWVLGYAALVPISKKLFRKIIKGKCSSLSDFQSEDVLKEDETDFFHIEVVATVPLRTASRSGRYLINCVGHYLLNHAKHVSASPITRIGVRLCKYFDFEHISDEVTSKVSYPIYALEVEASKIEPKLSRF